MIIEKCGHPGCFSTRPCARHPRSVSQSDTKTAEEKKFYNSYLWQKTRNGYRELHPWCELHLQRKEYVYAQMVDHIIRIRDGGPSLDPSNMQALCNPCHNAKRGGERHQ